MNDRIARYMVWVGLPGYMPTSQYPCATKNDVRLAMGWEKNLCLEEGHKINGTWQYGYDCSCGISIGWDYAEEGEYCDD